MINTILDIIRLLNDGNIVPMQKDEDTKIDLYNEKVQLFMDASGEESKYYYFSELEIDDENQDNLAEIEDVALNSDAYTVIEKPTPSDSYMILFWKVECIEERLYPDIIKIEENEFFYKKYVFYYTEKELQCFEKWCSSLKTNGKPMLGKYEDANKEYQTQLLNAIKIPLMVYSGRIIQNYPLGLGIRAVIKTNQLVFEAASKSGSDVYNILSTGQLNGLSIALLLSIKNVYGDTKGLDILLIDDPLQTIDDISAISLADLLTQQGIGQIVLSTHEEAKAALLRYKFKHAGMSVREQNMQALYMKTVTEE